MFTFGAIEFIYLSSIHVSRVHFARSLELIFDACMAHQAYPFSWNV